MPTCPDCGGSLRIAFPGRSANYLSCSRCGHVYTTEEK